MRAHDWSGSPLGPPDIWPKSLRTVVGLLLQSQFPMFVACGEELGFLYNDPYAEIVGAKHPRALGRRFSEIWSEIWSDISPLIDAAMAGHATYREDLPLVMNPKASTSRRGSPSLTLRSAMKAGRLRGCSAPSPKRRRSAGRTRAAAKRSAAARVERDARASRH